MAYDRRRPASAKCSHSRSRAADFRSSKARARRERIRERASRIATSLLPTAGLLAVAATYAVVHVLAARRRRRERVAATEFKAKVAPYLVEAPEL